MTVRTDSLKSRLGLGSTDSSQMVFSIPINVQWQANRHLISASRSGATQCRGTLSLISAAVGMGKRCRDFQGKRTKEG